MKTEEKIIPLNFDYVFVSIFNNPENIKILEAFLTDYLSDSNVKGNLKVAPRDLSLEDKNARRKQVDLILYRGTDIVNIELNNSFTPNLLERNVVYASNIHGGQLKYNDNTYSHIASTLQINLNASNKIYTKELLEEYVLYDVKTKRQLTKKLKIDVLNLQNYNKKWYTLKEKRLARWSKIFLASTKEELESMIGEDLMEKEVKDKLVDEVDRCSHDREFVELYSMYTKEELERNTILEDEKKEAREEGHREGYNAGHEEGVKEGAINKQIEIAKNLLNMNLSVEQIKEATGLKTEKIKSLIEK
jgi:predicted transposase/invertase (TIGR01784 family)